MTALSCWQPPPFPGVGHRDAVWNAILTHAGSAIALGERTFATFAAGFRPDDDTLCTRLRLRDGRSEAGLILHVVWRQFPFRSLFQAAIGTEDLPALPPALRDALIRGMTDVIAGAVWPQAGGAPPRRPGRIAVLASAPLGDPAQDLPDDTSWFDVEIGGFAGESAVLGVGVSRAALLASAPAQALLPVSVLDEARALITVPAAFTLGAVSFSAHELAHLTEETVILLPRSPPDRHILRVDKTILEFHAADGAWILAGRRQGAPRPHRHLFRKRDVTDQTRTHDAADPADTEAAEPVAASAEPAQTPQETERGTADDAPVGAGDPEKAALPTPGDEAADTGIVQQDEGALAPEGIRLADLGITVDFDIGEKDFTLAEIETWQPGAVVALDPPPLAGRVEVMLRVNGRVIATGDLIAIDDRLAVRLSRLLLRT
ncbi:FliM/FliN family flagellar motor switch protein [Pseudochelatococcus sp. B33]